MKAFVKFTDMSPDFIAESNCYIRALQRNFDVEWADEPDFVFYSAFGTEFTRYPKAVKIFLADEPVIPNFNDCDYAVGPMDIRLDNRYFRHPPFIGYGEKRCEEELQKREDIPDSMFERKFCNFIYSNAVRGSGAALRMEFCKKLSAYREVDCPGRVLNNMPNALTPRYVKGTVAREQPGRQHWDQEKLRFLSGYKFTIAFENTAMTGWITEKLLHPFLAHSIPIYWGAPDVAQLFNPRAFINCSDYSDFDEVVRRVEELDNDREQYMCMLREQPLTDAFPMDWETELSDFLSRIIQRGRNPFEKNPIGFPSMSAEGLVGACEEGTAGMRAILQMTMQCMRGRMRYRLRNKRKQSLLRTGWHAGWK